MSYPSGEQPEAVLDNSYSWEEVAAFLGIREDDLTALLPDTTIGLEALMVRGFTTADIEDLRQLICRLRQFATESVYGGGDL